MFDELNEKFQTGHTILPDVIPPPVETSDEVDFTHDSKKIHDTLFNSIRHGEKAIEKLLTIADATESPRAFEVLSDMIRTISDVSDRVLEIHRTQANIAKKQQVASTGVTNNMFIGSTHELMKMLKHAQQEPIEDAEFEVQDE
jgi:uncharacterized surface anchored protein